MMSHSELTWTEGLIPMIKPGVAADIISAVSDLALVISEFGQVTGVMCSPDFVGKPIFSKLKGAALKDYLNVESIPKFEARLEQFLADPNGVLPVELNHCAFDGYPELPVRYSFHKTGTNGSILLLGSDLRSTAEMQQQLVAAQIALENDYEAQREHDIRLRVLMESSDVPTVFISVATGNIAACNAAAELLLDKQREELIDASFASEFEAKGRRDVVGRMVAAATEQTDSPVVAKSIKGNRRLTLTPTLFRGASGQMLLCKIKLAGGQATSPDQLQSHLSDLYQNGVDSIVFVSSVGHVLSSNEAFLKLANVTHSQSIRGRPMVEFFTRGSVDLNVMMENARRNGSMRLYATKIVNEHGVERAVEISTTQLKAGGDPIFAMIIRDSRRVETVRSPTKSITDVDMHSVIELIGGQSLKDIVAKTTDVVEKMCIETAVEMTSNNRVAAAEMLGLSRQSLYVKLRKYGLVRKT